ncbi:MAG: FixH family protein [Ignavibacteria bacterium]|nr:FixH family protein [Ignavibacteria bacterium]
MKWNWGKSIALMIALFMVIWGGLLIFAFNQKVELVTPNYYEQELKYQQEIDRQKNTMHLQTEPSFSYENKALHISFPIKEVGNSISGSVIFYRPSDSGKDRTYKIAIDTSGLQHIPTTGLLPGLWKVKVNWQDGKQQFSSLYSMQVE